MEIKLNARAVKAAATFASTDNTRLVLTGVYVEHVGSKTIRITSTDSWRLVSFSQHYENNVEFFEPFLLPSELYNSITTKDDVLIIFSEDGRNLEATLYQLGKHGEHINHRTMKVQAIEAKYVQFEKIIGELEYYSNSVKMNPEYLKSIATCVEMGFGKKDAPAIELSVYAANKPLSFNAKNSGGLSCKGFVMPILQQS